MPHYPNLASIQSQINNEIRRAEQRAESALRQMERELEHDLAYRLPTTESEVKRLIDRHARRLQNRLR